VSAQTTKFAIMEFSADGHNYGKGIFNCSGNIIASVNIPRIWTATSKYRVTKTL